jgi:hypothetical protein
MKRRLKRLDVPNYVLHEDDFGPSGLKSFNPAEYPNVMFPKGDGWFYDRQAKFSWVQYGGKHLLDDPKMHQYTTELFVNLRSFSMNEEATIRNMVRYRIPLNPVTKRQWTAFEETKHLDSVSRSAKLFFMRRDNDD